MLTIRKSGTHVRIGYLLGGAALTNIQAAIQINEKLVWEGEVELFGGPFFPKIYAGAPCIVQILMLQIDDRDASLRLPTMTMQEAFGGADLTRSALPFGADSGHPSQIFISGVLEAGAATQNLATGTNYANNYGKLTPKTGFVYRIPANQAFTELTPAGRLASATAKLPSVFPQGGRLEIFSTQKVAALKVSAPNPTESENHNGLNLVLAPTR